MELVEYNELYNSRETIENAALFTTENLGEDKTYNGILNKYTNYKFNEHINFIMNDGNLSFTCSIVFSIIFKINDAEKKIFLFNADIEAESRTEINHWFSIINEDTEKREKEVNELLKYNLYDKVFIRAEMDIEFFKETSLDDPFNFESENEHENMEVPAILINPRPPSIIELPFISDNCAICLSAKPNILFIPCLHLSVCDDCEKTGKLFKCSVCRKEIEKKVKI